MDEIIENDKKQNPKCSYSMSTSESCSSIDGQFVCDILKQIQRHCPNEKPKVIYSFKEKKSDEGGHLTPDNDIIGFPQSVFNDRSMGPFGGFGGIGEIFESINPFMREFGLSLPRDSTSENNNSKNNNNSNGSGFFSRRRTPPPQPKIDGDQCGDAEEI